MAISQRQLNEELEAKSLVLASEALSPKKYAEIYPEYAAMAARMGVLDNEGNPPPLYIRKPDPQFPIFNNHFAMNAGMTQEGKAYIIGNEFTFTRLNSRELKAILGHELVHIKEGDVSQGSLSYSTPQRAIEVERRADIIGSGPLGSCDPAGLVEALNVMTRIEAHLANNLPSVKPKKGEKAPAPYKDHPDDQERNAYLMQMAKHPDPACIARNIKPGKSH